MEKLSSKQAMDLMSTKDNECKEENNQLVQIENKYDAGRTGWAKEVSPLN